MTQVLNTFSSLEQSRFEAYRRSTFRGDSISKYVAHCLGVAHEYAYARSERTRQLMDGDSLGMANARSETAMKNDAKRQFTNVALHDMVAPGQSEGIVVIVSTLAKAYAQRLVAAARRVADDDGPLLPQHIEAAHASRAQAGLDPGFFLQRPSKAVGAVPSTIEAAALGTTDAYEQLRNAALEAQEQYDKTATKQEDDDDDDSDDDDFIVIEEGNVATEDTPLMQSLEDALMNDLGDSD